jgi:threonine dehydrogenase-like Zn-dependent dehydrogenase
MIAVQLQDGRVSVENARRPARRKGYALIGLRLGGICNTDLELKRGYYGFRGRPGHEFVGEVVSADDRNWVGKRVVGEINLACGMCEWCGRGLGRHCPARTVLGIVKHPGAFAEYLTLPESNLLEVPGSVTDEHAVFTEPVAAACEILEQVRFPSGQPVAVLGDGKLGLLIAQVLQAHSPTILYGRHRQKMAVAQAVGVEARLVGKRRPRREFDYVVDATGSREGFSAAMQMVRPRGTLILKSTVHGTVGIDTAPLIVDEITIVGSRCGRFKPALKLIKQGKLNLDPMIAARFRLAEAPKAFARAEERGTLKVLLDPGG